MRPATACKTCREGKRKCLPKNRIQGHPCLRCQKLKTHCTFVSSPENLMETADRDGTDDEIWRIAPELRNEMIYHYFRVVHDTHHSLFHKPSFEAGIQEHSTEKAILYAILALGSRFLPADIPGGYTGDDRLFFSNHFAEKAHQCLDIRNVSLSTIQACILLGTLCYVEGRSEAEVVYYATATRLALVLDLPRRCCTSKLERQLNLRVWWTLYMIDIWSSGGLGLPRQLSFDPKLELPVDERYFINALSEMGTEKSTVEMTGIWGEMARLSCIWSEVQDLNRSSVHSDLQPMPETPVIGLLAEKLHAWQRELPMHLEETAENLQRMARIGLGPSFAALHLGFHYYHEVLFYRYMAETHQNPSPTVDAYAMECSKHATAFCDLLYLCEQTEDCKCMYSMVGHMLVITSTIYVHTLLFPKESEDLSLIRSRLVRNFKILIDLESYWPTLKTSLARLKAFHNACLHSVEHSFRMDRWMLRFIMLHGTSVSERFHGIESDSGSVENDVLLLTEEGNSLQDWYSEIFTL